MMVFRRWLGLALIMVALLLTACGASTQTAEPVATSASDQSAEASAESEDHEGEEADAHEGEDKHEGEEADAHEGEDEHAHDVKGLPELEAVTLADGERLRVVATTSIVGDVVAQVGGDTIELTVLLALGQDPHAYQPSAQDLATAAQADVIFVNGFDLEESLLQDLESAAEGVPIVPVSAGIEPIAGAEDEEEEGQEGEEGEDEHAHAEDPHVWFDVANVMRWTHNVDAILGQLNPSQVEAYEANAEAYEAQLKELDDLLRERVSAIPAANRKLVTNHDSFGYFAKAYGFDIIGTVIPTSSTNAEPSASDLSQLIETIKQEQVPAIFIDSGVSDELAQVVADETGAAVFALYSGALGAEGSGADHYLGMMRTNVERIEEGLDTK